MPEQEPIVRLESKNYNFEGIHVEGIKPIIPRFREYILFVPGLSLTAESGKPIIQSFAEAGWPSFSIDLRGRGKSIRPKNFPDTRLEDYIADLETVTKGLEKTEKLPANEQVLVGFSAGGLIAAMQSLEYPPKGLVLISSTISIDANVFLDKLSPEVVERRKKSLFLMEQLIKEGKPYGREAILNSFRGRIFSEELMEDLSSYVDQESPTFNRQRLQGIEIPPGLPVPTLIVGIAGDKAIPAESSQQVAGYLKADYIEGTGSHMIMFEKRLERSF